MAARNHSNRKIALTIGLACLAPFTLGSIGPTTNLNQRVLASHNRERDAAGIPPLQWDDGLAQSAGRWAEHLKRLGYLEHYPDDPKDDDPQGENLWAGTKSYYTAESMVGLWIAEKRNFRPGIFPANSATGRLEDVGHYTQLMWRSTGKVGCALAQGAKDEFLVCRYSEGGNVIGERPF